MKNAVLALLTTSLLASCSTEPPKCSDPETISLVRKIILEKIGVNLDTDQSIDKALFDKIFFIQNSRPSSYDDKIKKFTCDGTLITQSTTQMGDYQLPLTYESQYDDKKTHIVAVNNLMRGDLNQIVMYINVAIQTAKEAKASAAAAASPAQAPASPAAQPEPSPPAQAAATSAAPVANNTAEEDTVEKNGICKGLDLAITVDQAECVSRKYKAVDKNLNESYKTIMAALGETQKASLKKEQIAWIKEKESKCQKAGKEFEGGTMEPIAIMDCEVQMTEQRLTYLSTYK